MIPLPTIIKQNKKDDNFVIFEIEPLYPGYGVTIGNALRRVLLSSLEGSAVSSVKIKNASHEFSTIPGVKEDVLHVLMNLKELRFKLYSDEPQKTTLKVKGSKEVKGKDFDVPDTLKLINTDHKIATLTDAKAELEIEVTVEKGIGYKFEDNKKEKQDIGVISMDKIFSPIRRVNYTTEHVRVGDRTDFDKLVLEIETDGTILPEQALKDAIEILKSHINFIEGEMKVEEEKKPKKTVAKKVAKKTTTKKKK